MTLAELVEIVKRTARVGQVGTTNDQVTKDIVKYINMRAGQFWRRWPWEWSLESLDWTQAANLATKTFGATVGSIVILATSDGKIERAGLEEYYNWLQTTTPGSIKRYMYLGRDSSGNLQIKFHPTPSTATDIKGFGKKRHVDYTVTDIATNTGLLYFPTETHDLLFQGVLGDVYEAGDDKRAEAKQLFFTNSLDEMVRDIVHDQADNKPPNLPPASYIWKKRRRGGTQVA